MRMNEKLAPSRLEILKLAQQLQQKEVDYRREKRWRIFSWASSLLVGSIAGAVAITADNTKVLPIYPHKTFMIVAVLTLAVYAIIWIRYNGIAETNARKNLHEIEKHLQLYDGLALENTNPEEWKSFLSSFISYGLVVFLLALAAIAIILLS